METATKQYTELDALNAIYCQEAFTDVELLEMEAQGLIDLCGGFAFLPAPTTIQFAFDEYFASLEA